MTSQPVTIRPAKAKSRRMIIPVARGHYFERGGFTVSGDKVTVVARSGRRTEIPVSKVASVVLTTSTRGDLRVLLTDASGAVLAQDSAFFYSDDDLQKLASAMGRPFVKDPYRNFNNLEKAHPGTLRYGWERHPLLWVWGFGLVIIAIVVGIGYLT